MVFLFLFSLVGDLLIGVEFFFLLMRIYLSPKQGGILHHLCIYIFRHFNLLFAGLVFGVLACLFFFFCVRPFLKVDLDVENVRISESFSRLCVKYTVSANNREKERVLLILLLPSEIGGATEFIHSLLPVFYCMLFADFKYSVIFCFREIIYVALSVWLISLVPLVSIVCIIGGIVTFLVKIRKIDNSLNKGFLKLFYIYFYSEKQFSYFYIDPELSKSIKVFESRGVAGVILNQYKLIPFVIKSD